MTSSSSNTNHHQLYLICNKSDSDEIEEILQMVIESKVNYRLLLAIVACLMKSKDVAMFNS